MTNSSACALRGSQKPVARPGAELLSALVGGGHTESVLVLREPDRDHASTRVIGLRTSATRVHAATITSTRSLDQTDFTEYGKSMTKNLRVPASTVREGDNYYLSYDTGVRVASTRTVRGWVEINTAAGLLCRVRPNAEVRLHGRGISA